VFAKSAASPLAAQAGVRYVLSRMPLPLPEPIDSGEGYIRYALPRATGRASFVSDGGTDAPVAWLADDATRVALTVDAPSPGRLGLADQLYPGWTAAVDGRPSRIDRTDDVFRSVRLEQGLHTVTFRYQPAGFRAGLYLACVLIGVASATLATLAALAGRPRALS